MSARTLPYIPQGHWLLADWRPEPAVSRAALGEVAEAIRQGCQARRYWLRAYAALPERVALLLYPLEEATLVMAHLRDVVGRDPERLRLIRDDADLERAARFVEGLPVKLRLATRAEDYPWSSTGWLREAGPKGAAARR